MWVTDVWNEVLIEDSIWSAQLLYFTFILYPFSTKTGSFEFNYNSYDILRKKSLSGHKPPVRTPYFCKMDLIEKKESLRHHLNGMQIFANMFNVQMFMLPYPVSYSFTFMFLVFCLFIWCFFEIAFLGLMV